MKPYVWELVGNWIPPYAIPINAIIVVGKLTALGCMVLAVGGVRVDFPAMLLLMTPSINRCIQLTAFTPGATIDDLMDSLLFPGSGENDSYGMQLLQIHIHHPIVPLQAGRSWRGGFAG